MVEEDVAAAAVEGVEARRTDSLVIERLGSVHDGSRYKDYGAVYLGRCVSS